MMSALALFRSIRSPVSVTVETHRIRWVSENFVDDRRLSI